VVLSGIVASCVVDTSSKGTDEAGAEADTSSGQQRDSLTRAEILEQQRKRVELSTDTIEAVIGQRKARQDTNVLPADTLAAYVNRSFKGFTAGNISPSMERLPQKGQRQSRVSYTLRKGNQSIVAEIIDLNGNAALLVQSWKTHNRQIDYETEGEINRSWQPRDGVAGYISKQSDKQVAHVSVLVADRFLIRLQGKHFSDWKLLQDYVLSLPLQKMQQRVSVTTNSIEMAS
jgi:hypothetical protein